MLKIYRKLNIVLSVIIIAVLIVAGLNLGYKYPIEIAKAAGEGWYSDGGAEAWDYRIKITVNSGIVSSSLVNFPVYVNLDDLPSEFFVGVQMNGEDIRITDSSGITELPHEIVSIRTDIENGELYFKAPLLSPVLDNYFYIYYGNSSAANYLANAPYGAQNVWNEYQTVQHLKDSGVSAVADSTGVYNGTKKAASEPAESDGWIGKGQTFDGADDYLSLGDITSLNNASTFTISGWFKQDNNVSDKRIFGKTFGPPFTPQVILENDISFSSSSLGGGDLYFEVGKGLPTTNANAFGYWNNYSGTILSDNWFYADLVFDGNGTDLNGNGSKNDERMKMFVNGTQVPAANFQFNPAKTIPDKTADLTGRSFIIGKAYEESGNLFKGSVDEIRVSSAVRSASWITAEYNNQYSPSAFYIVGTEEIPSGVFREIKGFAWSENIGWVSFNGSNCDPDRDNFTETGADNADFPQCPDNVAMDKTYGVKLNNVTNNLFGYAWNDNIGWIKFNPAPDFSTGAYPACNAATCPVASGGSPNYSAKYDSGNDKITGWARACSGTINGDCNSATRTDGWDGWILLGPVVNGADSGVWIDESFNPDEFKGWAWGNEVVGWVSFNCSNESSCGVSDYKVFLAGANAPPSAVNLGVTSPDDIELCENMPDYNFSWNFSDTPGSSQNKFQLEIDNDSDFSSPTIRRTVTAPPAIDNPNQQSVKLIISADNSSNFGYDPTDIGNGLSYGGVNYYWRVKIWDEFDTPSNDSADGWTYPATAFITTPDHPYPAVDFSPPPPFTLLVNNPVNFTDNSTCYDSICVSFDWDFCGGVTTPALQSQGNCANAVDRLSTGTTPTHTYDVPGDKYDVILTVTDSDGHSCSNPENTRVFGAARPQWREVSPQ